MQRAATPPRPVWSALGLGHRLAAPCIAYALAACGPEAAPRPPTIDDCGTPSCAGITATTPDPGPLDAGVLDAHLAADASTVTLMASVVRYVDTEFRAVMPYSGGATVHFPLGSGSSRVDLTYGSGVLAASIVGGEPAWFRVEARDAPGVASGTVFSTTSMHVIPVPVPSTLTLPVIDRQVIGLIFASLAAPIVQSPSHPQVVLVFERAGVRVPGVRLTGAPPAHAIVYDTGGGFDAEGTRTGSSGIVVLANVLGTGTIRWLSESGAGGTIEPRFVASEATVVRVEVP